MSIALPSHKVPLSLVADIVTFIAEKPQSNTEEIMAYTGKSRSYITSGLRVAKILGIVNDDTGYNVQKEAISALGKTPSIDIKINVMRKLIQEYEPFILFVQFCMNDNAPSEAARKVFTLYDFEGKDSEMLKDLFLAWGISTGIFKVKADKLELEDSIDTVYKKLGTPAFSLDDDMAIRIYIAERLGTELSVLIDPVDIGELTDAFKKYRTEPRDAIGCAGRAFENYLRRLAIPLEVDVVKKNGITQIIEALQSNRKIHSKHNSVGIGIGAIRNMSGHGVDPKDLEPWELIPSSALAYIELVISTIRSLHLFTKKSFLTF
jgi:hypothetical protein